jgi:hypothetical protein
MYLPQKFTMATFGEVPRAVIPPSIGNVHTYLSPRSFPLPLPSLSLWRAERVPRTMLINDDDDFRRVVRSSTVILGPRACMGVILVKSGERPVRLPIWVCQAAPGGTGDLLNYCAPATSRR